MSGSEVEHRDRPDPVEGRLADRARQVDAGSGLDRDAGGRGVDQEPPVRVPDDRPDQQVRGGAGVPEDRDLAADLAGGIDHERRGGRRERDGRGAVGGPSDHGGDGVVPGALGEDRRGDGGGQQRPRYHPRGTGLERARQVDQGPTGSPSASGTAIEATPSAVSASQVSANASGPPPSAALTMSVVRRSRAHPSRDAASARWSSVRPRATVTLGI
ncbi:MAG: hypothetical protein ACXWXO_03295 [Nocardioides sp.]